MQGLFSSQFLFLPQITWKRPCQSHIMDIPAFIYLFKDENIQCDIMSPCQACSSSRTRWEDRRLQRQKRMPDFPRRRQSFNEEIETPAPAREGRHDFAGARHPGAMPLLPQRRLSSSSMDPDTSRDALSSDQCAVAHNDADVDETLLQSDLTRRSYAVVSHKSPKDILPHKPRRSRSQRRIHALSQSRCYAHAA
jgi:hypothetical protein